MKREIIFRGRMIHYDGWIYGNLLLLKDGSASIWPIESDKLSDVREVAPDTIGQYTGLKDKNGKMIFEGDVVKWDDNSNGEYWRVCKIVWDKAHYELHGYTFNSVMPNVKRPVNFKFGAFLFENDGILEIIGNIYENPDLLQ